MAVQTQLFHDRQQGPNEGVDENAEELKKLFAKAYAWVSRGKPEAEAMARLYWPTNVSQVCGQSSKARLLGLRRT